VSIGIYNDPRPDHIAHASRSGQISWMVPWMGWTEKGLEQQTQKWQEGGVPLTVSVKYTQGIGRDSVDGSD
jgi:hypothetical protein